MSEDVNTNTPGTESEPFVSLHEEMPAEPESAHRGDAANDLASAFFAEVSQVDLLTREEEGDLGGQIARSRKRVRAMLRSQRRLVEEALRDVGRGLVHPADDFREREALLILGHARKKLAGMGLRQRGRGDLRRFVERLEAEMEAYRGLRDRMMTANIRLVMTLARRYRHPTLSFLDLVQEGVLGLMRAVEKYEPSRNIKFSTYAVWWIWQQISRAADCQGALIRTPVHWNQMRRKLGRIAAGESERATDEVAEEHGLSPQRLAAMAQPFQCLSLTAPLGDEDERTLADTIASEASDDPEGVVLNADIGERLSTAVGELPDREAQILRLRFGLDGSQVYTLEEIGQRFGVSRERIRQLEARALRQMRAICAEQGISEAVH